MKTIDSFIMVAQVWFSLFTEFKTFTDSTEARLVEAEGTHRSRGNEGMDDSMREMIKKMEEKIDSVSKEAERERTLRKEMEEKMDQLRKDLQAAEYRAREAMQRAEQNNREIETVKRTAERSGHTGAGGAGVQGRAGKGGGWDVGGGGNMEERVMMLEQRTEQQERETSTLKVRAWKSSVVRPLCHASVFREHVLIVRGGGKGKQERGSSRCH